MGKTIGIDLGTTNSVIAFKDATVRVLSTGSNHEDLCRSCVALDKSGNFAVGNVVYKNWKRYAPNIVVSVKRLMGAAISDPQVQKIKSDKNIYPYGISKLSGGTKESVAIIMDGKEFLPEQISAEILRQLKTDASVKLGDEVTHAVITVPAYFNEKQKTATRKAAELAGLKVQRLLAEPTAAAISYGADKMSADEDKIFLVYDFGGGTFDLSILVASGGNFIESGTGGDRWLGGDDIDRLIHEYVIAEAGKQNGGINIRNIIESLPEKKKYAFQGELKDEIEGVKKALSQSDSASIAIFDYLETVDGDSIDIEVSITRETFESMIRPLVQRTIDLIDELLEKTAYPIDVIDNILLVGGSSCIPLVRMMLCDKYGKSKILSSEKPMLAIAEGAAILSHSMGTESECPSCGKPTSVGEEICPFCKDLVINATSSQIKEGIVQVSITTKHKTFIEIANDADEIIYKEIIDENIPLPHEVSHKFFTLIENQKIIGVKLFTNAENNTKEKLSTGFFIIPEDLPVRSELQFTFMLTEDEIMSLKVRVPAIDKTTNVVLSRGSLDSHCLETISSSFEQIMNSSEISDSKKTNFLSKIQKSVEIISTGQHLPDSRVWQDIENQVSNAARVANVTDDDDSAIQVFIASILIQNFGKFISEEDKVFMQRLIDKLKTTNNPIEKSDAFSRLEKLSENYSLFTHGFMFKILGNDESDPVIANKALIVYNQFMVALNNQDLDLACDILASNNSLLEGLNLRMVGGFTTNIGG